jgi:hypothetical protein
VVLCIGKKKKAHGRGLFLLFVSVAAAAIADRGGAAVLKATLPNTAKAAVIGFAYLVALAAGGAVITAGGGVAIARPNQLLAGFMGQAPAEGKAQHVVKGQLAGGQAKECDGAEKQNGDHPL